MEYKKRIKNKSEKEEIPLSHNLFSDLKKLMHEENFYLKKEHGEEIMYRNYGMVLHKKCYARRMKLYPTIFGIINGLFITYSSAKLLISWGQLPKPFWLYTIAFLLLLECSITYILQPEREEKLDTFEKKKESKGQDE